MRLEPIGRLDNIDALDFEPLTIPIVGYTEDKTEVVTDVRFLPTAPVGFALDMLRSVDSTGNVAQAVALRFIEACVYPDDREVWHDLVFRDDLYIVPQTIAAVYQALGELYADRPLGRRSGSRPGPTSTKRTSTGGSSSRASHATGSARRTG